MLTRMDVPCADGDGMAPTATARCCAQSFPSIGDVHSTVPVRREEWFQYGGERKGRFQGLNNSDGAPRCRAALLAAALAVDRAISSACRKKKIRCDPIRYGPILPFRIPLSTEASAMRADRGGQGADGDGQVLMCSAHRGRR